MFKTDYLSILSTQSATGNTAAMMAEINRQLDQIDGLTKETDDYGNLYVTKGQSETYPAFVCHTDTVHKIYDSFVVCETKLNYIYAYTEDEGFATVGVGGDDKSGIIACLELLTRLKTVKCVFFLDEEQGCKGSAVGNLEFFNDCRYAVQIDRKGGGDIIIKGSGTELCSEEFKELLETLGKKYKYETTTGATTDVVKLKDRGLKISACNLSAGYYNPHTKQEYIDADELLNCINFCVAIAKIKTVYPHVLPVRTPPKTSSNWTTPSGNVNSVSRRCAVCNEVLGYNFGILCNKCVINNLTLTVDENDEATITLESLGVCNGCNDEYYTEDELVVSFCFACQFCSVCKLSLQSSLEMKLGVCNGCIGDEYHICSGQYCTNILVDKTEQLTGYCSQCVVWNDDTFTCMIYNCGSDLKSEREQENGMCDSCALSYT